MTKIVGVGEALNRFLFFFTCSVRARSRPTDHYPEASGGSRSSLSVFDELSIVIVQAG